MLMPGVEASESELRERLADILCATPPLMRVLSVARGLCLPDWLVFSGAVYQPVLNHLTGRALDYGIKQAGGEVHHNLFPKMTAPSRTPSTYSRGGRPSSGEVLSMRDASAMEKNPSR